MSNGINALNSAKSSVWLGIDTTQHTAQLNRDHMDLKMELADINRRLADQQKEVTGERTSQNSWAQVGGCIIGGIIGAGAGPLGIISGCSTGGKILGTVSDWAYDSEMFDSAAEIELQQLEKELEDMDFELSEDAKKYNRIQAEQFEWELEANKTAMLDDYLRWEDQFYGQSTGDYVLQFAEIGLDFAMTKFGENILTQWKSGKELSVMDQAIADYLEYNFQEPIIVTPK